VTGLCIGGIGVRPVSSQTHVENRKWQRGEADNYWANLNHTFIREADAPAISTAHAAILDPGFGKKYKTTVKSYTKR